MDWTVIVGPAAGILIVIIDRLLQRRKASAEAGKALAEADLVRLERKIRASEFWERLCHEIESEYAKLGEKCDELTRQIDELTRQVDALAREQNFMKHMLGKLWAGLTILLRQLADNHIPPAWEPDAEMARYCSALMEDDRNA